MHQRILLRARKGPFDVFTPEETFAGNWIGDNNGNLVFSHAAHKLLATSAAEIIPSRFRADERDADEINEKYDVFVIPLANAFRRSFVHRLAPMTRLIERLKIPVVVLGVGVQTDVEGNREYLRPIDEAVTAFCRAVLDRSHSIGVRGEVTESYLRTLGFSAVEQIGCPSMFLTGDSLRIEKAKPALAPEDRVALTISPYVSSMAGIVRRHHERYPNLRYLPQDLRTLGTLLYGDAPELRGCSSDIPLHTSHPFFVEDKVRMFVDPWTWMDYLSGFDFAFGTRIHGTITALVSGTPGYLFAHPRAGPLLRHPAPDHAGRAGRRRRRPALRGGRLHGAQRGPQGAVRGDHRVPGPARPRPLVRRRGQRQPLRPAGPRDHLPAGGPSGRGHRAGRAAGPHPVAAGREQDAPRDHRLAARPAAARADQAGRPRPGPSTAEALILVRLFDRRGRIGGCPTSRTSPRCSTSPRRARRWVRSPAGSAGTS
jgi:hypothetical protein